MGGKERGFKYTLRQKNLSDTLNHQNTGKSRNLRIKSGKQLSFLCIHTQPQLNSMNMANYYCYNWWCCWVLSNLSHLLIFLTFKVEQNVLIFLKIGGKNILLLGDCVLNHKLPKINRTKISTKGKGKKTNCCFHNHLLTVPLPEYTVL